VKPVGGDQYVKVDVRVVAATNRALEAEVEAGRFRKDLLFRLAVGRVKVPSLRARADDVPALAAHFAASFGATLAPPVLAALAARPWPGNVRELRNVVERTVMLAGGGGSVVTSLDDGDDDLDDAPPASVAPAEALLGAMRSSEGLRLLEMSFQDAKQAAVETFEREYLLRLFEASGHNLSEAGRRSGVDRRYLRELFKKHDIDLAAMRAKKP
jgi:DNA-binding NtrC family response regulator